MQEVFKINKTLRNEHHLIFKVFILQALNFRDQELQSLMEIIEEIWNIILSLCVFLMPQIMIIQKPLSKNLPTAKISSWKVPIRNAPWSAFSCRFEFALTLFPLPVCLIVAHLLFEVFGVVQVALTSPSLPRSVIIYSLLKQISGHSPKEKKKVVSLVLFKYVLVKLRLIHNNESLVSIRCMMFLLTPFPWPICYCLECFTRP